MPSLNNKMESIKKDNKVAGITTYLSTITVNVNGLNFPIKRHRLVDWIKKQDPTILSTRNILH
jgi:hypothetical protein